MGTIERASSSGFLLVLLLAAATMLTGAKGCNDDPAEAEPTCRTTESESESEPAPGGLVSVTTGDLARTWRSESCGDRTYAREMVLLDGGTYVRVDLVSPCPPGARCVWSGILTYRGSWSFDGTAIAISGEQQVGATGGGDAFGPGPRKLIHQADPLMLVEPLASARCEYLPAEARDVGAELKMKAAE